MVFNVSTVSFGATLHFFWIKIGPPSTSLVTKCIVHPVILSLFLTSLFFTINSIFTSTSTKKGIIISPIVEVRSEPNNYSKRLFQVHEGLKVEAGKNQDKWLEIELIDGKKGWIVNKEVRLIF